MLMFVLNLHILSILREFCSLKTYIDNWYSTTTNYAKCDVNYHPKQKIQTEQSHQQNVAGKNFKRTCITVLNTLSHHVIKVLVS